MARSSWSTNVAALGLAAVASGVLVLRSRNASGVGVDRFVEPPQAQDWLDTLSAWNSTREVGAALVLVGLLALAGAAGTVLGRNLAPPPSRRVLLVLAAVAAVLLVAGVAVVAYPREYVVVYDGTYQLAREPVVVPPTISATTVWSRDQAAAALTAAAGLLLAVGVAGVASGGRRARLGGP